MKEITLETGRSKAREWHAEGKSWHFHALAPDCIFNEREGQYTLLLENHTDNQVFAVYSAGDFVKVSQELVKLLHGAKILDKEAAQTTSNEEAIQSVLARAAEIRRTGGCWHHHMLFPDCVLNQHAGKWNIVFEDPETDQSTEILYDEQPVADLRRIEVAYFEQADPSF